MVTCHVVLSDETYFSGLMLLLIAWWGVYSSHSTIAVTLLLSVTPQRISFRVDQYIRSRCYFNKEHG